MNEPSVASKNAKIDLVNDTLLRGAFVDLQAYDQGSDRGALLPIDQAVAASVVDASTQRALESQLLKSLRTCRSAVAGEFICSKLALIGSQAAVPALARLLADPQLSTSARNALEAIPSPRCSKALRDQLLKVSGAQRIGVINSLGARRDPSCVSLLATLMRDEHVEVASAAIAALGAIGTLNAAQALEGSLAHGSQRLRQELADAARVCIERLIAQGHENEAQVLRQRLSHV